MKKPYMVWNAYEEMPAWCDNYATVAEALAAAERKKEMYRVQGFYSTRYGRIPFESLTVGVLWADLSYDEFDALTFFVVDERMEGKGGHVSRGSL